jgi:hypothetical protein
MPYADSAATQVDLTLRRQFKLLERLTLQARGDFLNIFNHPNFGPPINYLSSPLFEQSTQMLGPSLASGGQNGGLNPLYQVGAEVSPTCPEAYILTTQAEAPPRASRTPDSRLTFPPTRP